MIITEDQETCMVKIGEIELFGWIIHEEECRFCTEHPVYHDKYDAKFCPQTNKWIEDICSDQLCGYCKNRPENPL